jgi:glycosyltransferase involved in cell wall biosynthesis
MNKRPFFSIIIPIRTRTEYLSQTLKSLANQTYKEFEVLIIDDQISGVVSPAVKRNLGALQSKGTYLAFLDDDSYPYKNWLKNIKQQILLHPDFSAFCGPCLTPDEDNIFQQASGLVWSSYLGSGGAGTYRNSISPARNVSDYPSVNLIVKKSDFKKVHGFNTHHWPGEDTILCLDIITKLQKTIYYHPSIMVYHHRRPVIIPHLQQITRYALHRGHFAKIYPQTSFKISYLTPSLFFIYLVFTLTLYYYTKSYIIFLPYIIYFILIIFTFITFIFQKNKVITSILAVITIPITHLYYGILFIIGFFTPYLSFKPHKIINQKYHGG